MSKIANGRTVSLIYREKGPNGGPQLTVNVSGEDDILPHEHRDDIRTVAEELLGVPLGSIPKEMEVEVKRTPHGHPHSHWPQDRPQQQAEPEPQKGGA